MLAPDPTELEQEIMAKVIHEDLRQLIPGIVARQKRRSGSLLTHRALLSLATAGKRWYTPGDLQKELHDQILKMRR